jgi:predicted PurR-regulated permease PerM
MNKPLVASRGESAQVMMSSVLIGLVIVGCLYWAQTVLIPVALGVFFAFLLNPLVSALEQWRLGRAPAVISAITLAASTLGIMGWAATHQVVALVDDLPNYTNTIKQKVRGLRDMTDGTGPLGRMLNEISQAWRLEPNVPQAKNVPPAGDGANVPATAPPPEGSTWLERSLAALGSVAEVLGRLGLALILALFMLLQREDLRNRLLRLIGSGRLTLSTKALDEAGTRISRFLIMQLILNVSFGILAAGGLALIGVEHALLWGFLAALLRYVPYLGIWIAAVLPITLSIAMFEGWLPVGLVVGLYLALELVVSSILEPLLFGKSMGVSAVAMLISAAFWGFLWGPVGMVLSSPLTVCLVVLGRYVPHLAFLDVLLGDEPALDPQISFYQRLLARDQDEATALVLTHLRTMPNDTVYDSLLVPALNYGKQDRERDAVTQPEEAFILHALREIVEDLGERQLLNAVPAVEGETAAPKRVRILGLPGHDEGDRLMLEMLQNLLDPIRWDMEVLPFNSASGEQVALAAERQPAIICIGAHPPGGLAHARFLCKRLKARLPKVKLIVGRWGLLANLDRNRDDLQEAGADVIETGLIETRTHLEESFGNFSVSPSPIVSPADKKQTT